jgi:prepilin-type N-terminal cleavage/methylation domain-containing protein
MKRNKSAFTLVEVLVVIGIIAVLMGILVPTVTKVRRQALTVKCMNNQKQLLTAVISYARENDDLLPYTSWGHSPPSPNWANDESKLTYKQKDVEKGQLWKYLNNYAIYHCPQDIGPWPAGSINNLISYVINGAASGYGDNNLKGLSILSFKPNDVLFWEICSYNPSANGANDVTNFPSEGVMARHKKGTTLGHIDGHVDVMSAEDFNTLCQRDFPNMLYCSPLAPDGGHSGATNYPNPIKTEGE